MSDPASDTNSRYAQASIKTADDLRTIAQSIAVNDLSRLSLPEIHSVVDLIARVAPAGNVPGVILSGLARLPGRRPPENILKRDVNLLFKGVDQVLDKAVYSAFFAGPAAVIWGYQNLLKLAGKDPEHSFPEGTWQFYVDYALREDTARHTNETHGFDTLLGQHDIQLSDVDRITAWVMTAIYVVHQYEDLLENEWRERVYTHLLREVTSETPDAQRHANLYREWEKQRPYARGTDAQPNESFPAYRHNRFDRFFEKALTELSPDMRREWLERVRAAKTNDLPAYQRQMSILAYLNPDTYSETRTPIPLESAHVGVIYEGRYYLVPCCQPNTRHPLDANVVREQIAAMIAFPSEGPAAQLTELAVTKRAALAGLYQRLNPQFVEELNTLRLAPILLNFDRRSSDLPLSELRNTERGVGDHALTVIDTGATFIFDQSHIFFDGAWGAALAEIMTNEALSWAAYLDTLPTAEPGTQRPYSPTLQLGSPDQERIRRTPRIVPEVGVESDVVNLKALLALRRLFRQRSDLLQLTVNDLLILYRAIHAVTYSPNADLIEELQHLANDDATRVAAISALDAIEKSSQVNPTILIPVDASQRSPRDRLYPMSLEVPLAELDLLGKHDRSLKALQTYNEETGDRAEAYAQFDKTQRAYLGALAGFGTVMSKAKEIAIAGESASVGSIKLLAHMPAPLQRLLDQVPGRFDILNDIIKGREVFSNVGMVAPSSTLTRFITAKDDNEKKTLAWGVMTDAEGVMRITLRDFRPHVDSFITAGHEHLAKRIAQDYLDAYGHGLNTYINELRRITLASRETRMARSEPR